MLIVADGIASTNPVMKELSVVFTESLTWAVCSMYVLHIHTHTKKTSNTFFNSIGGMLFPSTSAILPTNESRHDLPCPA